MADVHHFAPKIERPGSDGVELAAQYVSEFGERVVVPADDKPTSVPAGKYRVEVVRLKRVDADGRVWHYTFSTGDRAAFDLEVAKGRDTLHLLLSGLELHVSTLDCAGELRPGELEEHPLERPQPGRFQVLDDPDHSGDIEPVEPPVPLREGPVDLFRRTRGMGSTTARGARRADCEAGRATAEGSSWACPRC